MSQTNVIPTAQSEALLSEIEQQTNEECRMVMAAAQHEALALIRGTHSSARRRAHAVIEELRNERVRRLARAKAKIETEARQRAQQYAIELIERAWPLLLEALDSQWHDPAARLLWTTSAARCAHEQLRAGEWAVEHPADWSEEEQQNFRSLREATNARVCFVTSPDLSSGIRIRAGEATLDATPQGLLSDRSAVAALLLAEIDREALRRSTKTGP